tara:strand:+ start:5967 stop:7232 length:1266 start_codon:yes stop_codon:yes gene_type:complete
MSGSANKHAKLSPSGSHTWHHCTAAPRLVQLNQHKIPEDTGNAHSNEGTQAHDYSEEILNEETTIEEIPEDFREAVGIYVDECRRLMAEHSGFEPFIEEAVPLWYSPEETGTIDFAIVDEDSIIIRDLKYGAGVYVQVEGNTQQAIYARSLAQALIEDGFYEFSPETVVDIGIVQPRHRLGDPVRSWVITLAELYEFCKDIEVSVNTIESNTGLNFAPSEDACRWCDAKAFCPARAHELTKGMPERPAGVDFLANLPDLTAKQKKMPVEDRITEYSEEDVIHDDAMVEIFERRKSIISFLKDVEEYLSSRALAGDPVDGTKLVQGRQGNRAWVDDEKAETFLANQKVPVDSRRVTKVISLTAAETFLKSKLDKKSPEYKPRLAARFAELTYRSPGKPVLAHESDTREALTAAIDSLDVLVD